MSDEPANRTFEPAPDDAEPEVFALTRQGSSWKLSRRGFLGSAGSVGAAGSSAPPAAPAGTGPATGRQSLAYAHHEAIPLLAFAADGQTLLSGSLDRTVKTWSVSGKGHLQTLTGPGVDSIKEGSSVFALALNAENKILVTAAGGFADEVALRSLPDGNLLKKLSGAGREITALAVAPDGSVVAAALKNGQVKVWAAADEKLLQTLDGPRAGILAVALTPDGQTIACAASDGTIKVWQKGQDLAGFREPALKPAALALSPNGKLLLCASSGEKDSVIRVWPLPEAKLPRSLKAHTKPIRSLAVSPDGKLLASGDEDGLLFLWDLTSGQVIGRLGDPAVLKVYVQAHRGAVTSLSLSPKAGLLVSSSADQSVKIWSLTAGKLERKLELKTEVRAAVVTPGGELVAAAADKSIKLFSLPKGEELKSLDGHEGAVTTLAVSADGTLLASGGLDRTIRLWSLPGGELGKTLKDVGREVSKIVLSADGRLLACAAAETVQFWSLPEGNQLRTLRGHAHLVYGLDLSVDGRLAASGSNDETARLWTLSDGRQTESFSDHGSAVGAVLLTPDAKSLISGGGDRILRIRSLSTNGPGRIIGGHAAPVRSLAISPDGKLMASADDEGVILLWDLASGSAAGLDGAEYLSRGGLFDPAANQSNAISYRVTNRTTGITMTYTLPCGSPIPSGAVCVCNCVAGTWSAPSGGGGGGGFFGHYWYPT